MYGDTHTRKVHRDGRLSRRGCRGPDRRGRRPRVRAGRCRGGRHRRRRRVERRGRGRARLVEGPRLGQPRRLGQGVAGAGHVVEQHHRPALPCPALHGHGWQVDGDAAVAVALLGAHGVLQAVARGCLGHPLGRFAVGAHQQRAGALLHDPVGQQRRAICIKILTPLTGAAGAATGPAGYRSPYKEGHRGPAAHRECARHCLAAAFPRAAPCRPPPPGGAGCQT